MALSFSMSHLSHNVRTKGFLILISALNLRARSYVRNAPPLWTHDHCCICTSC